MTRSSALKRPRRRVTYRPLVDALEARQLLSAAEFALTSLLPANGGDGSNGFVVDGVVDRGIMGYPFPGFHPVGDINQDGIDDFVLAAPGNYTDASPIIGHVYLVFGRAEGFPAELDLNTLDGTSGYRIDGLQAGESFGGSIGGAGDLNHDGIPDLAIGASWADLSPDQVDAGRSFVLFGGSPNLLRTRCRRRLSGWCDLGRVARRNKRLHDQRGYGTSRGRP